MKVQTTVLLLCFFTGVFLSVRAKPSPALMNELIALEKYLEKKEGSEDADSQNDNLGEMPNENPIDPNKEKNDGHQMQENQPIGNGPEQPNNENNNNEGGKANTEIDLSDLEVPPVDEKPSDQGTPVPPEKPDEGVKPENGEQGSGHSETGDGAPHEEEGPTVSGGEGEGEKPQEGNKPSPSEEKEEKERDKIFKRLDETKRKLEDAIADLDSLGDEVKKQLKDDDFELNKLQEKYEQTKQKTKENLGKVKTVLEDMETTAVGGEDTRSVGKKSVRDNAPARRSQISDTEFLNIVHSLLKNN